MERATVIAGRIGATCLTILLTSMRSAYAQVIGTQCWNAGGMLQCNSQAGILYTPPSPFVQGLAYGAAFSQMLAQQRALRRIEEQAAQLEAEARQNASAPRAAAMEREAAAQRLYLQQITAVVGAVSDSPMIFGEVGRRFGEAIAPSLADLYKVDPLATRERIVEVLWPHLRKVNSDFEAYLTRVVPSLKPAVDSLALSAEEAQLFTAALLVVSQDAFMLNPDGSPADYRFAVAPLLQRARAYFDSTRAGERKRPRPTQRP